MKRIIRQDTGNTMISILVSMGLMTIMASVFATLLNDVRKNMQSTQQKMEILQLEQTLMGSLADPNVCGCNFDPSKNTKNSSPLTFNSANNSSNIQMSSLFGACVSNRPELVILEANKVVKGSTSNLRVSGIRLADIQPTGTGNNYRANLVVDFDQSSLVLARQPASVPVFFQADTANPAAAKIVSCSSGSAALAANGGNGNGGDGNNNGNGGGGGSGDGNDGSGAKGCIVRTGTELCKISSSGSPPRRTVHYACKCAEGENLISCFGYGTDDVDAASSGEGVAIVGGTVQSGQCTMSMQKVPGSPSSRLPIIRPAVTCCPAN